MKNDKSLGADRFTSDFFFWPDLKYFVIRAIYKSYETGELSLIFQNKNNLGDNFMHYTIIHLILSYQYFSLLLKLLMLTKCIFKLIVTFI